MAGSEARQRLATVVFVDIVGSTALASRVGDQRWRDVLSRFHRIGRAAVKRGRGRVQDTAGDGLLATFANPVAALETAARIVLAAQEIGVNVRAGVHTGACVEVDGNLQGIAVNIGARVTALAGAAELLTTGTVKDLVAGSAITFGHRGFHELKGVEGEWQLFAVAAVSGEPLPAPIGIDESVARVEAARVAERPLHRRPTVTGGAALVVAAAIAIPLLTIGRGGDAGAAISLVRIDGRTGTISKVVRDGASDSGRSANLWVADGTLWQLVGSAPTTLVERDAGTGRIVKKLPLAEDVCTCSVAIGFGAIWFVTNATVARGEFAGTQPYLVRLDELSGRRSRTLLPGTVDTITAGNAAVWLLAGGANPSALLERVDPFNARLRRYEIPGQCCNGSLRLFSTDGYEWISGVGEGSRFDTRTARVQALSVPAFASGYPELVADAASSPPTAWAIDEQASTLMQLDVASGLTSAPIGLQGHPRQAVFAFGAIWVAAGAVVDRIGDLTTPQPTTTTIAMPTGVSAGSIAADPATSSVWVGNTLPPTAATQPSAP